MENEELFCNEFDEECKTHSAELTPSGVGVICRSCTNYWGKIDIGFCFLLEECTKGSHNCPEWKLR